VWASLEALKIAKPMVGYEDQISGDEKMSTVPHVSQSRAIRVETVLERKQTPPAGKKTNSTAVGRLYQRNGTGSQSAEGRLGSAEAVHWKMEPAANWQPSSTAGTCRALICRRVVTLVE